MDVFEAGTPDYSQAGPSQYHAAKSGSSKSSGLTLVLPALKGGKPIKSSKKLKNRLAPSFGGTEEELKKIPRPVKLKPLKEVLTKLISQIKKKDDYAFFLKPVDVSKVQGYSEIVKRPMDLGTMSIKVERNKYRSLDEFEADLRLVTLNAKAFNPPGSIYYTEAERIEAWALDHIYKAAGTVIQYETDWNIEIEKDDETTSVNIDDDGAYPGSQMEVEDSAAGRRSPSVASQSQPPGTSRRPVRAPYKKPTPSNKLSESIDAGGRLPGSRDGLSAFPPNSDWARTMLFLKLKGKRYKTKKERLRIEKEGPPLLAEGSLDYTEMEDPFSVLSVFAAEPYTRPLVTPLKPPLFSPPALDSSSQSQSEPPRPTTPYPTAINVPYSYSTSASQLPTSATIIPNGLSNAKKPHWIIIHNPTRSKLKDRDEDAEMADPPAWQVPREAQVTDFGSYAVLSSAIEEELRKRQVSGNEGEEEEKVLQAIRETVVSQVPEPDISSDPVGSDSLTWTKDYWNARRASAAESYLQDVVYGGPDGLAYVRSLAEFLIPLYDENAGPCPSLGMSLATWVERQVVDPLTGSRHALLRETAIELAKQTSEPPTRQIGKDSSRPLSSHVKNSLQLYPSATMALAALLQINGHKIDMGCLIKTPEELFQSEEEWAGKALKQQRSMKKKDIAKTEEVESNGPLEIEEPERTWMDVTASSKTLQGQASDYELEGPEELNEVMEYAADVIIALNKKIKEGRSPTSKFDVKLNISNGHDARADGSPEDPVLRNLRLNLLALAKRAPLDTIARLPKELVPEHIRHFVPTLSASS